MRMRRTLNDIAFSAHTLFLRFNVSLCVVYVNPVRTEFLEFTSSVANDCVNSLAFA